MATKNTRWIVRGILIVSIIGVAALGFLNYWQSQPETVWSQYEQAYAEGDLETADLYLRRLLTEDPSNVKYQKARADLNLALNQQEDPNATIETSRDAANQLVVIANMAEDDLEAQTKALDVLLANGQDATRQAIQVASRIRRLDAENPDALYVLARQDFDADRHADALEKVEKVTELEGQPSLRTLAFRSDIHRVMGDEAALQASLEDALALSDSLSVDELANFNPLYRARLLRILEVGVIFSETNEEATERMVRALDVLERLQEKLGDDKQAVGELGNTAAIAFSYLISQTGALDEAAATAEEQSIQQRVEKLAQAAIDANVASPAVYLALGRAAFHRGDRNAGFEMLQRGIAASVGLPESETPTVMALHRVIAVEYVRSGRPADARVHLEVLFDDEEQKGWAHLIAGAASFISENMPDALEQCLQARRELGNNVVVTLCLGQIYMALGRFDEALPELEKLLLDHEKLAKQKLLPSNIDVSMNIERVHMNIARCLVELNEWEEAQKHLEAIRGTDVEPEALQYFIVSLWEDNRRPEAVDLLTKSRQKFPDNAGLVDIDASIKRNLDQPEAARELIETFATNHPEDLAAQELKLKLLEREGRLNEAYAMLDALRQRYPDRPAIALRQALMYLDNGDVANAMRLASELRDTEVGKDVSQIIELQSALRLENFAEVSRILDRMDDGGRHGGALHFWNAVAKSKLGNLEGTIDALGSAMGVPSVQGSAQRLLMNTLMAMAEERGPADAAAKVAELQEKSPNDPMLVQLEMNFAFQQGKFDEGMAALDHYERLQPNSPRPPMLKASAWWKRRDSERALRELNRALAIDPSDVASLVLAAEIHLALEEPTTALQHTRNALRNNPQLWGAYITQARALRQLGRTEESLQVVERLVEAQPQMELANKALIDEHMLNEDPEKAYEAAHVARSRMTTESARANMLQLEILALCMMDRKEDLAALEPNSETVAFMKARAWQGLGKTDEAIEALENALSIKPDFLEARISAARLNLAADRNAEALAHCMAAVGKGDDLPDVYLMQAEALKRLDRRDEAVEVLRRLIDAKPELAAAYVALADTIAESEENDRVNQALSVLKEGRERVADEANAVLFEKQLELLLENNQLAAAEQLAANAAGTEPDAQSCFMIGSSYMKLGYLPQARSWVERADIAAESENERALVDWLLGDITMREAMFSEDQDLMAEARDHFAAANAVEPTNLVIANNLAMLLGTEFEQPDEALDIIQRAVGDRSFDRLPMEIIDTIARIQRKKGSWNECQSMLESALEANPEQSLVHLQLGLLLAEKPEPDLEAARTALEKAIELGLGESELAEANRALDELKAKN